MSLEKILRRKWNRFTCERCLGAPDRETEVALDGLQTLTKHWLTHLEAAKEEGPKIYSARWRALGHFCHTILSSAEFAYGD